MPLMLIVRTTEPRLGMVHSPQPQTRNVTWRLLALVAEHMNRLLFSGWLAGVLETCSVSLAAGSLCFFIVQVDWRTIRLPISCVTGTRVRSSSVLFRGALSGLAPPLVGLPSIVDSRGWCQWFQHNHTRNFSW